MKADPVSLETGLEGASVAAAQYLTHVFAGDEAPDVLCPARQRTVVPARTVEAKDERFGGKQDRRRPPVPLRLPEGEDPSGAVPFSAPCLRNASIIGVAGYISRGSRLTNGGLTARA